MCLSLAVRDPDRVLGSGTHAGFEWMVLSNMMGHRCGYVRLPAGHPWHGLDEHDLDLDVRVHGGVTFAEADLPCDKGGPDDAFWLGFDFAHCDDEPDPELLLAAHDGARRLALHREIGLTGHVWTQAEVEAECQAVCEQAARAATEGHP